MKNISMCILKEWRILFHSFIHSLFTVKLWRWFIEMYEIWLIYTGMFFMFLWCSLRCLWCVLKVSIFKVPWVWMKCFPLTFRKRTRSLPVFLWRILLHSLVMRFWKNVKTVSWMGTILRKVDYRLLTFRLTRMLGWRQSWRMRRCGLMIWRTWRNQEPRNWNGQVWKR